MKKYILSIALIALFIVTLITVAYADEKFIQCTVTFKAEFSTPIEFPDGYGVFYTSSRPCNMPYSEDFYKGEVLNKDQVPEVFFLGDGMIFEGWDVNPVGYEVTEDITFTAKFNNDNCVPAMFNGIVVGSSIYPEHQCGDMFVAPGYEGDPESRLLDTIISMKKAGEPLTEKDIPIVRLYTGSMIEWDGWTPEPLGAILTEPTEFILDMYTIHRVIFFSKIAHISDLQFIRTDCSAIPPEVPELEGYVFFGWDKDFSKVTQDMDVHALVFAYGDANMDEVVNTADAVTILRHCASMQTLSENALVLADVNRDTVINTSDAVKVLRIVADIEE